ncbi:ROK family protein [Galbibacter sp. BG1]|uniref:ROK family protein n=1 Tax=Galbibacter sp. BG1 TaxID=1170699 RepID=UPI0015B857FF|nr:ROK family protein [Galbibacter sp. BG1]QLE02210.1 ROK family protein [Galbibacter sp. BG1]
MSVCCGIDLGGTKIEGVLIEKNKTGFRVIERLRVPTEKEKGYTHILSQIKKVVQLLETRGNLKITALGIGTPGSLDPKTQTLKNSNTVCLIGKPIKKDLENLLGISIEIANDANCFALAEATLGVVPKMAPHAKNVFGVIMGTGVGGGVVINGKILNGRNGIGGEWGHNYLEENGDDCYCGQSGCVETVISGTALELHYQRLSGTKRKLKEIYTLYQNQQDEYAEATIERMLDFFGKGISAIINTLDPDVIVIGGGVGNIDLLYTEGVQRAEKYAFNKTIETMFLKPELGDSAGVFGAAMLVQ